MTTMTAYCGLTEVGLVKKEDTVVISGAAGATGGAAVQIAKKIFGCKRVIGIAGGPEKVSISLRPGLSTVFDLTCPLLLVVRMGEEARRRRVPRLPLLDL